MVRAPQRGCALYSAAKMGGNDMNSTKSAARPWLLGCAIFCFALAPLSVSAQTSGPIKIGVIAEAQAVAGSSIPLAAQLAADEINAAGGLDGRKIEIFSYDNHSSARGIGRGFICCCERGSRQCRHRQLRQRGRAGAPALDRTPENGDDNAGRRLRRHHPEYRQGLRPPQIHVPRLLRPRPALPTPHAQPPRIFSSTT